MSSDVAYKQELVSGIQKSLRFKYMLATSSCLYAGFDCELQLAVSENSTCMLYLGELARNQRPQY